MNRRQFFSKLTCLSAGAVAATPALAQDMGQNGMAIPSFFFSGAERRARDACENRLPECRPDVRRQMDQEKEISLIFPWMGLGATLIGLLLVARKREKERERRRKLAQARHVPGAHKHLDEDKPATTRRDDADDRF